MDGGMRALTEFNSLSERPSAVLYSNDMTAIGFMREAYFLDGSIEGKNGKPYELHSALCLETQHFSDSPSHPDFPSVELKPGQRYHTVTVYSFSVK